MMELAPKTWGNFIQCALPAISLPPQTDFINTSAEVKDLERGG